MCKNKHTESGPFTFKNTGLVVADGKGSKKKASVFDEPMAEWMSVPLLRYESRVRYSHGTNVTYR